MNRHIDDDNKTVYFEGDWPGVYAIPHIMKKYPGYEAVVLSHENYTEKYGES